MAVGALQPHQIDDMVKATLPDLGRFEWTNISFTLREHIVMDQLMRKNRVSFSDGMKLQFNVKVDNGTQARQTGLYDTDNVQVGNVLKTAEVPWTFAETHFAYEIREPAFNGGKSKILDLLKLRRSEAMQSAVELMEKKFWAKPDVTATKDPHGLFYWLVPNDTEGFNGGHPSGFSDVAGLSSTTHPTWRNWSGQYADAGAGDDDDNLVPMARKASHYCMFKPPVSNPTYENGVQWQHLVPYSVLRALEKYLKDNNENIGMELAKYDGNVVFKRVPVEHAPYLDNYDSETGVYKKPWCGVNWGVMGLAFLQGQYMRTSDPISGSSHTTRAIFTDWTYQYQCRDRRRQFILHSA